MLPEHGYMLNYILRKLYTYEAGVNLFTSENEKKLSTKQAQ